MTDNDIQERPTRELGDEQLECQAPKPMPTATRSFLHGNAEHFGLHATRMLELEWKYIRRSPKRAGTAPGQRGMTPADGEAWSEIVRGQSETVVKLPDAAPVLAPTENSELAFLKWIAGAPVSRLNKLEGHYTASDVGLDREAVARPSNTQPPLLATDLRNRAFTESDRARTAGASA